jgi:putative ABC transport system permease protein
VKSFIAHPASAILRAEITESFLMAMNALAAHKLRSALTLVGVLIGVFSIIVVMTAMRVMQRNIETELSQLGTHTFVVQKFPEIFVGGNEGWEKIWRRKRITFQHALLLKEKATLAEAVAVETDLRYGEARSRFGHTTPSIPLFGVSPESFTTKSWIIEAGRGLSASDLDGYRNVCVLGNSLAQKLFPHSSGVGEKIKFEGLNYSVVGVLEAKGKVMGGDQDAFVAIPITTGLNRYGQERSLSIQIKAPDEKLFEDTMEQVRGLLRTARKVPPGEADDFELFSNDTLISQFRSITQAARIGAAIISSIALLAAGIGIMNIMLVSVTERTREIGIRRAIGAKKRNILTQFILEAIVLCEVGGVIGVVLGIIGGNLTAYFLEVPPSIPLDWVGIGLLICSIVGVIFGTYPAFKAANLDPIESLRYE